MWKSSHGTISVINWANSKQRNHHLARVFRVSRRWWTQKDQDLALRHFSTFMLSGRDDYSDNLLVWLILPDETFQYLANFHSAELPTDCMVVIQHQFNFGPGFSLLSFCLDSLTCGENISMLRFPLEAFLYMFTGAFMFVTSSRALFSATLRVIKMHDFKSSGLFFLNKNKTYQLVMQTTDNRVHSSGKTCIKPSHTKLQHHSPLPGTQQPGSCRLLPTAVGAHCTSLSLCIGLLWRPNSSISRSLLVLREAVAGTKTAISYCLIGFLIQVWWMTLFGLLPPPLSSFPHLTEKGTRGKREK